MKKKLLKPVKKTSDSKVILYSNETCSHNGNCKAC